MVFCFYVVLSHDLHCNLTGDRKIGKAGNGIPWQRFFALVLGSVGIIGIGAVGWRLYQNSKNKLISTTPLTHVIHIDHKHTAS